MVEIFLLSVLLIVIFSMPFSYKKAEENLEVFLFLCGLAAVTVSMQWSKELVYEALHEPLRISLAVLVVGLLFKKFHVVVRHVVHKTVDIVGLRITLFLIVFVLGSFSSVITAIVAALILCELAAELCLNEEQRLKLIIYTCFAISVGSVITPIGEPLGTIVIAKLAGEPHNADTFFVVELLWPYLLSAILFLSYLAYNIVGKETDRSCPRVEAFHSLKDIVVRTLKVYIFVVALVLIGKGLMPLAYKTIFYLPPQVLYWVNILSATLDNATLAAIEIVPEMNRKTLTYMLVSLVLGGGILIQGNIANILCASKFKIKSSEWAKLGVPLGILLFGAYFIILFLVFRRVA